MQLNPAPTENGIGVLLPKIGFIRNDSGIFKFSRIWIIYPASRHKEDSTPSSKICTPAPPILGRVRMRGSLPLSLCFLSGWRDYLR